MRQGDMETEKVDLRWRKVRKKRDPKTGRLRKSVLKTVKVELGERERERERERDRGR